MKKTPRRKPVDEPAELEVTMPPIRVTREQKARWRLVAKSEQRSVSSLVRDVVDAYCASSPARGKSARDGG